MAQTRHVKARSTLWLSVSGVYWCYSVCLGVLADPGSSGGSAPKPELDPTSVKAYIAAARESCETSGSAWSLRVDAMHVQLSKRLGRDVFMEEVRQVLGNPAKCSDAEVMLAAELSFHDIGFVPYMRAGLARDAPEVRVQCMVGLWRWRNTLEPAVKDDLVKRAKGEFDTGTFESQVRLLWIMGDIPQKEDIPALRRFALRAEEYDESVGLTQFASASAELAEGIHTVWRRTPTGVVTELLLRLDDPEAVKRVSQSVLQEHNIQERVWAVWMCGKSGNESLMRRVGNVLQDRRVCPTYIHRAPIPETKRRHPIAFYDRRTKKIVHEDVEVTDWEYLHTRVCDVAVRAIHAMGEGEGKWPFAVPGLQWFHFDADCYQYSGGLPTVAREGIRFHRKAMGFSDDQIAFASNYVKKRNSQREDRMKREGKGCISVGTSGLHALVDGLAAGYREQQDAIVVAVADAMASPELAIADHRQLAKKGARVVAAAGVAVVTNVNNKVENLSWPQCIELFDKAKRNWRAFSGVDAELHRYAPFTSDPSAKLFHEKVLPLSQCGPITRKKTSAEVIAAVAMDPQGIGFVDYTAIPKDNKSIKVLGIVTDKGIVRPEPKTILDGTWPISQQYYLYVNPRPARRPRTSPSSS